MKKVLFFDKNYGLTPVWNILKNGTIWSAYFYRLETILFYLKDLPTLFSKIIFCPKTEDEENAGLIPLENMQICDYLKCIFFKG